MAADYRSSHFLYRQTGPDALPPSMWTVAGSIPWSVLQHSFVQIGLEIISAAILSLLLIKAGQLSVTGERMCTQLPRKIVVRLTDRLGMTVAVDWDVKTTKQRQQPLSIKLSRQI